MGKSSPKAPAAPDPAKTAAAQTATNKETALWNAYLNNVNQITPYGSLTYTTSNQGSTGGSSGGYDYDAYNKALAAYNAQPAGEPKPGSGGNPGGGSNKGPAPSLESYRIGGSSSKGMDLPPQFTSTITLSPEQQKLYETQTGQQQQLLDLGGQQINRINQSVSTPYSYSGIPALYGEGDLNAARTKTEDALFSRLNPQFAQDEEALRTRLINQGIGQGSEAYRREMDQFNQTKNDARMQAILAGGTEADRLFSQSLASRNQGIKEYDTQRNAPLNEYIGLTSGTQVQNPQFSSTGYQGAAPVDYAGLINQQYQGQLNNYNQKVAGQNSTSSSLFGLGGSLLGAAGGAGGFAPLFKGFFGG